jgi:hypothetical protein
MIKRRLKTVLRAILARVKKNPVKPQASTKSKNV